MEFKPERIRRRKMKDKKRNALGWMAIAIAEEKRTLGLSMKDISALIDRGDSKARCKISLQRVHIGAKKMKCLDRERSYPAIFPGWVHWDRCNMMIFPNGFLDIIGFGYDPWDWSCIRMQLLSIVWYPLLQVWLHASTVPVPPLL